MDPDFTKRIFQRIRSKYPERIGGLDVDRVRDITVGYDSNHGLMDSITADPTSEMVSIK